MTTRALRRPARVLAVLAITAPALGAVLASSTPAAFASSGSITSPSSDAVVTSSSVDATASVTLSNHTSATLAVNGPGLGSGYTHTASYDCTSSLTKSCASTQAQTVKITGIPISSSNANGQFTVALSGSVSDTSHFYTNFAPLADPTNLAAAPNGRTEVDLSWSYTGSEPDRAGFEITETHAGSTRTLTVGTSACSGSTCGTAITYPQPAAGSTESYSYTVTALRKSGGCPSCGDVTRSSASPSASAQLVGPPPPPSPTPSPSSGTGGTTGSGGTSAGSTGGTTPSGSGSPSAGSGSGSGTTGSTASGTTGAKSGSGSTSGSAARPLTIPKLPPLLASRRAFALGFNSFSPSLGIPKLPPLPKTAFPVVEPGSGSVYQPTLPYTGTHTKKTTSVLSSPIASIRSSLDGPQLARFLAIGMLLLAVAAHVRVFLGRTIED